MKTATTSHMYYLPEHAIPHLVHLLAHRPQFGEADLKFEAVVCNFLLAALTHSTENYSFLWQLLRFIKTTEDAEEPESEVRTPAIALCATHPPFPAETPRRVRLAAQAPAAKDRPPIVERAVARADLAAPGALPPA